MLSEQYGEQLKMKNHNSLNIRKEFPLYHKRIENSCDYIYLYLYESIYIVPTNRVK